MNSSASEQLSFPFPQPPGGAAPVELADGILWFRMPLPLRLDHVNVYAVREAEGWSLVDTGMNTRTTREAWKSILGGPLAGVPVWRVIATHHHPDHIGLAGWFRQEHGAEIWTTRTAWLTARMLTLDVQDAPAPEVLEFYRSAGMDRDEYEARASARPFNFVDCVHAIPLGFTRIKEGDSVTLGGMEWDVRTGGGHAPEHATLWCRSAPLVFAGDQVLAGISPNIGVYATEPDADPLKDWLEACARLEGHATDDQLVMSGHKLPFRGLPLRLAQLQANHASALEKLVEAIAEPRTAAECFRSLYGRKIGTGEYGLALGEAVAHLNHLRAAGRAERRRSAEDGAWRWEAARR